MTLIPWLDRLNYRAGIFDIRGTLIDLDTRYKRVLYIKIVRDFGKKTGNRYLSSFNQDDLEQLLIMSPRRRAEALERFGLDRETFNMGWVTDEALEIRARYSRVQPDARALQVLKSRKVKLAVVTSASKRAADMDVGMVKGKIGSRIFDEIVIPSYEAFMAPKPDPEPIWACVERLSVSPEETFAVGNSARDIASYKAAGVMDVLIDRRGDLDEEYPELEGIQPSRTISSLDELIPMAIRLGRLSRLLRRPLVPRT